MTAMPQVGIDSAPSPVADAPERPQIPASYGLFRRFHGQQLDTAMEQLETLPAMIAAKQQEVADAAGEVTALKARLDEIKAITAAAIAVEVNPDTGKPMFSNDGARAAELTKRLAADADYRTLTAQLRELESDVSAARFEVERLQAQFAAARSQTRLLAGVAGLFAGQ